MDLLGTRIHLRRGSTSLGTIERLEVRPGQTTEMRVEWNPREMPMSNPPPPLPARGD